MSDTSIYAKDLHAGDWITCPGQGAEPVCWVSNRRAEGDQMIFVIGRGPGHVHRDVVMAATDRVTLHARWPDKPKGMA